MARYRTYIKQMPLGWKIVLGILGAGIIFSAVVGIIGLCNGQSFVEAFETLFGIAEKAVEETPAVEETVAMISGL